MVATAPLSTFEIFLSFFQEDKSSAPDVFGRCSFIPRTHFETSSVMVSFYGYEICRHKYQVVKPFLIENRFLSTIKVNLVPKIMQSAYSCVKHKKLLFLAVLT